MSTETSQIVLEPKLPVQALSIVGKLYAALDVAQQPVSNPQYVLAELLQSLTFAQLSEEDRLLTQLFLEILQDLVRQGWSLAWNGHHLLVTQPQLAQGASTDPQAVKQQLRAVLVDARDEQLREPSVQEFILDLERPRRHQGRYVTVLRLFAAPADLAADLQRCLNAPASIQDDLLRASIKPYLQMATDERDEFTNLRLIDIWRYCRYTWSLPLNALPGRQMFYLVRDGARPFHPIIGIGALGSSIVQITDRDTAIGWEVDAVREVPYSAEAIEALGQALDRAIADVYWQDLVTEQEVAEPSLEVVDRLEAQITSITPSSHSMGRSAHLNFHEAPLSPEFTRKRAIELARLLRAKQTFQRAKHEVVASQQERAWLFDREEGQRALGIALRSIKKRHIGSSMMDITTCGALPPYNDLLGGKLVSLLMASPTVIAHYRERYRETASEIASRMKGEPVVRPAELVLLGTTSLYGSGSSQYNRLAAPVAGGKLEYKPAGKTKGYGGIHLSRRTYRTVQKLLDNHSSFVRESNAFAAGVNYKMRSIGAALTALGLSKLQQHSYPRLVYLVPLARNWREYLTDQDDTPQYLFENLERPEVETEQLISFWKERWFLPRVKRPEIMERLRTSSERVRVSRHIGDFEQERPEQLSLLDIHPAS